MNDGENAVLVGFVDVNVMFERVQTISRRRHEESGFQKTLIIQFDLRHRAENNVLDDKVRLQYPDFGKTTPNRVCEKETIMQASDIVTILKGLAATITIVGTICTLYKWIFNKGYKKAKEEILNSHYKLQYEQIYAPLRSEVLDIQITSASLTAYPYLRQRIKRSWELLRNGKVKPAFQSLRDKGKSESHEIEFGRGFPLGKIKDVLTSNAALANPEIMNLYQRTDRAQYESQMTDERRYENELLREEYMLFRHIIERYEELSKRFA